MKKIFLNISIILIILLELCVPAVSYAKEQVNDTDTKDEQTIEEENKNDMENENKTDNDITDESLNQDNENNVDETKNSNNTYKDDNMLPEDSEEALQEKLVPELSMKAKSVDVVNTEILGWDIYAIITILPGSRAVGIDGGKTENGANVNLWDDKSVEQQRFKFEYHEDGYYTIVNVKSGKLLDVVGSGMASGTLVDQWEDNGGHDNQKWILKKTNDGYYSIISKLNGMYLTVNGSGANCDLLCVANEAGTVNQKFKLLEKGTPKGEKTVEEGIYKIVLANAPTQSLTVDGGKTENGANVHIWTFADTKQQLFRLEYDGEGYYKIINEKSGKLLDVVGTGNEANVDQWEDNGGNDNQRWVIRKSSQGNYNIVSKRDSLYLDAYRSGTGNGTNIEVYDQSGGKGQEFKLQRVDNIEEVYPEEGTYKIVLANAPTQSLTVDGGKIENGANVHIWGYVDCLQQQFNLEDVGDGYYEIIPLNSGKRLDVVGLGNESNVDQWQNNGGNNNQKWKFVKSEQGNYNIVSRKGGLYLDAYGSSSQNGNNIQVYEKSGGSGQEFKLEKIADKSERTVADKIYKLAPQANTNIVVEASASNYDNEGRIQIWEDCEAPAQRVNVQYYDGYYRISLCHSGKYLTVRNNSIQSGSEIVQFDWTGGDNQKWIIRDNGDGSIGILPLVNPDLTIDILGAIGNGSILELYNNEKNAKQRFCLLNYFDKHIEEGTYGVSGLKVQGNGGYDLRYYKIGNGSKRLFLNFSIHGFEDSYDHDGAELTYLADQFYSYIKKNISEDLVNKWTIYILPVSNPDGQYNGSTNNGPGRTTLYSKASGHKGIDMNRCFPIGYKSLSGDRNYTGSQPLQAYEAQSLYDFISGHLGSQNIVIDVHGWMNETIGDDGIGWYYRNQFGISNHIGTYGNGYLIQWARSLPNTRSMLLELPQVWNHSQTVDWGYSDKFNNATMQILRDF